MRRIVLAAACCAVALAVAAAVLFLRPSEAGFQKLDDPAAEAVLRESFGHGVTVADGRRLYDLIRERGYTRALDVGTARGYSSVWFGLAMKKNGGRVVTIELDPARAAEARVNFRRAGLDSFIESRVGDALVEIPAIQGEFDFAFLDTGAPLNKRFLDLLYTRMRPGGVVAAHNAIDALISQRDFLRAIRNDTRLDTRFAPTASGGISLTFFRR